MNVFHTSRIFLIYFKLNNLEFIKSFPLTQIHNVDIKDFLNKSQQKNERTEEINKANVAVLYYC